MPRQLRPIADGLLDHALNRGNNRTAVFDSPHDYRQFLHALAQTQRRYPFRLFGYCLMTNHFHLLLAPEAGQSVSRILQSLTVAPTWHDHQAQRTCGHVWQGRFKSPVVQSDEHALTVLRYVEANPLRAGLVKDLAGYPWSRYADHGLGRPDPLLTELPGWEMLGQDAPARQERWRRWVHEPLTEKDLAAVRKSVTSGRPYGADGWAEATAKALGLKLSLRPRGRPKKQPEK